MGGEVTVERCHVTVLLRVADRVRRPHHRATGREVDRGTGLWTRPEGGAVGSQPLKTDTGSPAAALPAGGQGRLRRNSPAKPVCPTHLSARHWAASRVRAVPGLRSTCSSSHVSVCVAGRRLPGQGWGPVWALQGPSVITCAIWRSSEVYPSPSSFSRAMALG